MKYRIPVGMRITRMDVNDKIESYITSKESYFMEGDIWQETESVLVIDLPTDAHPWVRFAVNRSDTHKISGANKVTKKREK